MRCLVMFITAVCLIFLLKLKWPKNKSVYTFKLLVRKKFKNMEKKAELNKENCVKWLADIGASTSDSKQELTMRINRFSRYPGPVQKIKEVAFKRLISKIAQ